MGARQPTRADGALTIQTDAGGDVAVVTAAGEIDISSAEAFGLELRRALSTGAQSVVLDLEQVSFIDSTGLTALLAAIEDSAGRLRVMRSLSPAVERMLEVSGLMANLPWT
jgi:anti-anti-sigma factor